MAGALGESRRPSPRPTASADPGGPVQPLDVDGLEDIPLTQDGATRLSVDSSGATISTDVEGVGLDIRLDEGGVRVTPSGQPPPEP